MRIARAIHRRGSPCWPRGTSPRPSPGPTTRRRRLLEDGRNDLANGRARQGLDALQTIVTGFPNSQYADDALLDIGRYAEDVEKNLVKAREVYDQIAKRYPQSDAAPGAYLQMGRIAFATAASQGAYDDALANFQRVIRLYPESAFRSERSRGLGRGLPARGSLRLGHRRGPARGPRPSHERHRSRGPVRAGPVPGHGGRHPGRHRGVPAGPVLLSVVRRRDPGAERHDRALPALRRRTSGLPERPRPSPSRRATCSRTSARSW